MEINFPVNLPGGPGKLIARLIIYLSNRFFNILSVSFRLV